MRDRSGGRPKVYLDEYILKILNLLSKKDYTITELAESLGVDRGNLQRKIQSLEEEGVVILDRSLKGRTTIIKINPKLEEGVKNFFDVVKFDVTFGLRDIFKWSYGLGKKHKKLNTIKKLKTPKSKKIKVSS